MKNELIHPVLAIDYGEARIGLAITDLAGILAHPLETIDVKKQEPLARIVELVKQRAVTQVVLGLPLCIDGSEGSSAEKTRAFGNALSKKLSVPLSYQDESFTTIAAAAKLQQVGRNAKRQKRIIDQAAAVEILENWLLDYT